MGRKGNHKRALTEGNLTANKRKAKRANSGAETVRWVVHVKGEFIILPVDWYSHTNAYLRKMCSK